MSEIFTLYYIFYLEETVIPCVFDHASLFESKCHKHAELYSSSHIAGTAKQQFTTMRCRSHKQIVSLSVQRGYEHTHKKKYKYPGTENSCLPVFQHSKQLGPWRQPPQQHDFHDNAHVVVMHADRHTGGRMMF